MPSVRTICDSGVLPGPTGCQQAADLATVELRNYDAASERFRSSRLRKSPSTRPSSTSSYCPLRAVCTFRVLTNERDASLPLRSVARTRRGAACGLRCADHRGAGIRHTAAPLSLFAGQASRCAVFDRLTVKRLGVSAVANRARQQASMRLAHLVPAPRVRSASMGSPCRAASTRPQGADS
jgi:hypothetical protein